MNIGFSGCSFTYGAELKDEKKDRYSTIVCRELDAKGYNISQNGISNDLICKNIYDLSKMIELDFAVIQITSFLRFSFAFDNNYKTIAPRKIVADSFDRSLAKYVYASDTDYSYWYNLNRWKIDSIHSYLSDVPHIFLFSLQEDLELYLKDKTDAVVFDKGLRQYCIDNDLPIGEFKHPLELAHEKIAMDIVVPMIKEMI
jgi:hypothetical protein